MGGGGHHPGEDPGEGEIAGHHHPGEDPGGATIEGRIRGEAKVSIIQGRLGGGRHHLGADAEALRGDPGADPVA